MPLDTKDILHFERNAGTAEESNLLLLSLLRDYCESKLVGEDPRFDVDNVFKSICDSLITRRVLDPSAVARFTKMIESGIWKKEGMLRLTKSRLLEAAEEDSSKSSDSSDEEESTSGLQLVLAGRKPPPPVLNALLGDVSVPPWADASLMANALGRMLTLRSRFDSEFRVVRKLGKGGYGSVVSAVHRLDGKVYAIKRIRLKQKALAKRWHEKALREVQMLASLEHPHVVRYYTAWVECVEKEKPIEKTSSPVVEEALLSMGAFTFGGGDEGEVEEEEEEEESDEETEEEEKEEGVGMELALRQPAPQWNAHGLLAQPSSTFSVSGSASSVYLQYPKEVLNAPVQWETSKGPPPRRDLVLFIQMELCEDTLHAWLRRPRPKGKGVALEIFRQILVALSHLHSRGVVHRDLKPANIFLSRLPSVGPLPLSPSLVVRLGDFGLAKCICDGENSGVLPISPIKPTWGTAGTPFSPATSGSEHTAGLGTPTYSSPEQLAGHVYTDKTDMYSVGVILLELFHPFATGMERGLVLRAFREDGTLPEGFCEEWPDVAILLRQLCGPRPSERPTAEQLLEHPMFKIEDPIEAMKEELKEKDAEIERLRAALAAKA